MASIRPRFLGRFGGEEPLGDPVAGLLGRHAAAGGDHLDEAFEQAVEHPVVHLLRFRAGRGPHEHLAGALVVAAGQEVGLDSQAVEEAAEEQLFPVEAGDPDVAGGGDADPLGSAHEGETAELEVVRVGEDRLAVLLEAVEPPPGILRAEPSRGGAAHQDDDPFDVLVFAGLVDAGDEAAERFGPMLPKIGSSGREVSFTLPDKVKTGTMFAGFASSAA